jgi:hypothetical protein
MRNRILSLLFLLPFISESVSAALVEEKDYVAYLFTYFTGNHISEEAVCYGVSMDGYTYYALNNNKPVLDSKVISSTGGVRDPHIPRGEDGQTFYMVLTDMVSDNGWDSNRAMVLLKSTDLVNWSHSVINMQKRYPGQEKLKRVWAPQTIYNKEVGKYMVYWSMQYAGGVDVIYYAYANEDFTDLEGEPKPLFIPKDKKSCIDGDIVYKDGVYHLFYKTEGHGNGIKVATTRSLTSGEWEEQPDYKQQTKEAVEGAGTFKLIGQDKYILMYDVYMKGAYQFTETTDLKNFKVIDHAVQMNFHPRHGTIIPITRAELKRITDKWGKPAELGELPVNPVLPGFHADPEVLYSQKTQRYYIYSFSGHHWHILSGPEYPARMHPSLPWEYLPAVRRSKVFPEYKLNSDMEHRPPALEEALLLYLHRTGNTQSIPNLMSDDTPTSSPSVYGLPADPLSFSSDKYYQFRFHVPHNRPGNVQSADANRPKSVPDRLSIHFYAP